jgi:hypothetical protein
MDGIFKLLANSFLLKLIYPFLIVAVGYGVSAYFRLGWLESKVVGLQEKNYELQVHLANCLEVNEIATGQIRFSEEQCRRLIKYVENQPKPKPSTDDDSDLDDLVNRLLRGQTPGGTKTGTDGKSPGSSAP